LSSVAWFCKEYNCIWIQWPLVLCVQRCNIQNKASGNFGVKYIFLLFQVTKEECGPWQRFGDSWLASFALADVTISITLHSSSIGSVNMWSISCVFDWEMFFYCQHPHVPISMISTVQALWFDLNKTHKSATVRRRTQGSISTTPILSVGDISLPNLQSVYLRLTIKY
jgi:hypothetical protein